VADRITDDCDDEYVAAIGRALDQIDSIEVEDGTRFQAELAGELRRARMALFTAIGLRLGELALEACPPEKEAVVMNAATTLANPKEADRSEVTHAKEVVSFYL
jgi:hypothetical protein